MERQSYILLALLVVLVICIGVFIYQYNNDVPTFIILNQTEVKENESFSGMLMDSYGQGVANKTVTYYKPNSESLVNVTTNKDGGFVIKNSEHSVKNNDSYDNFTFAGDERYQGCSYEGNVVVVK